MQTLIADYTTILPQQLPVCLLLAAAALMGNYFWSADSPDFLWGWYPSDPPIEKLAEGIAIESVAASPAWDGGVYVDVIVDFSGFHIQFNALFPGFDIEACKAEMLAEIREIVANILKN